MESEFITSKNVQRLRARNRISKDALTCLQNLQGRDPNLEARIEDNDIVLSSSGKDIGIIYQKVGSAVLYENNCCKDMLKRYALGIEAAGYKVPEKYLV